MIPAKIQYFDYQDGEISHSAFIAELTASFLTMEPDATMRFLTRYQHVDQSRKLYYALRNWAKQMDAWLEISKLERYQASDGVKHFCMERVQYDIVKKQK
jgi:hypothetical protein